MKAQTLASWIVCGLSTALAAPILNETSFDPQAAATRQLVIYQNNLSAYQNKTLVDRKATLNATAAAATCSADKVTYRREWGDMPTSDRKAYTDAVMCLMKLPALSSLDEVPGARSRYDDFVAMHIYYAPFVHQDGVFLTWHRYFVHLYEKALKEECGYKGAQPYWDWTKNWSDLSKSPVFDGGPYSMGSNGKYIPNRGPINDTGLGSTRLLNPGSGGGCIERGPFSNLTINLGPVALLPAGPDGGFGYNPRCLTRDFSQQWLNNTKPTDIVAVINANDQIAAFDVQFEALLGPHAGGHFGVGGMMPDQYASTADPIFWLHHGMMDRTWTLWQGRNPAARLNQVGRTLTNQNNPPSANATLDSVLEFGILSTPQKLRDLVSTIDGPFCYQYL